MATDDLTSEDVAAGTAVAAATAAAAEAEPTPAKARAAGKRAAAKTAAEHNIKLSEEDAEMLADMLVDRLDQRGAFSTPPEPITAPPAAAQPPGTVEEAPAAPHKRTFAEHFRGS